MDVHHALLLNDDVIVRKHCRRATEQFRWTEPIVAEKVVHVTCRQITWMTCVDDDDASTRSAEGHCRLKSGHTATNNDDIDVGRRRVGLALRQTSTVANHCARHSGDDILDLTL